MKNTLIILALVFFTSCSKNDTQIDYVTQNDEDIQAYIATNNLDAKKSNSGLYYVIDEVGPGGKPTQTDDVTVAYKGYFLNGSVFDQSNAEGISFNLQEVINGWTEGITYFNEGGKGILLIPSHLGYGSNDYNQLPGGSVLIFDINLISID